MLATENYVRKLIEENLRIDSRKFDEFRPIKIETGLIKNAEGSAKVLLGDTHVLVGVKLSVGEPFSDIPDEGVLIVDTELVPVASPTFEPGPPDENAIEIARVIDRGIRESKCIDLEKLCIEKGEKVWVINIDVHVLDHDGNLIDAGALGAIAALLNAKLPKYEDGKIIREETQGKLPIRDIPIAVTTGKILDKLFVDPCLEEENAMDARITITTMKNGEICSVQKGGIGHFTTEEIEKAINFSITKGKELRKIILGE